MKKKNSLFIILLLAFSITTLQAQTVYYVTAEADGSADGLSWATATTLDAAIANTTGTSVDVIFVKKGTYTAPSVNGTYSGLGYYFEAKNNVTIYGNCDGVESISSLPVITASTTIQTFLKAPVDGTNLALGRVISIYNSSVTLVGLDISGGDATKAIGRGPNNGGAVWIYGNGILEYCKIHNSAATIGGGVYLTTFATSQINTLNNCEIYSNTSTSYGGGIYNLNTATIKNCIVRNNSTITTTGNSGGIYNSDNGNNGTTIISNCIIENNTSAGTAGIGGVFHRSGIIVNCLVMGNTGAAATGGISLVTATAKVINSTIVNNVVTSNNNSDAGGISVSLGVVKNCVVWGNSKNAGTTNMDFRFASGSIATGVSTVVNSCYNASSTSGGTYPPILTNNLAATNPLFTNATSNDFKLTDNSPCHDAGDNSAYDTSLFPTVDLNNNARKISTIDMGAYEYPTSKATDITPTTGIATKVYGFEHSLYVNAISGGEVSVYSITGLQNTQRTINVGITKIELPAGVYIVLFNGQTYKAIVK